MSAPRCDSPVTWGCCRRAPCATSTPSWAQSGGWHKRVERAPGRVLLNEGKATLDVANAQGFRYFTDADAFKRHVATEALAGVAEVQA